MAKYAPRKIQSISSTTSATDDQHAVAYNTALTAHSLLVAAAIWHSGSQTCTVASSNNSNWTAIGSPQRGTGNLSGYTIQLFYKLDCAAGADTVTMTCSDNNDYRALAIHEFEQVDYTDALEASISSTNVTASGNVITSGSVTTENKTDLLFCGGMVDSTTSSTVAPLIGLDMGLFGGNPLGYRTVFGAGSYTAKFNTSDVTDASLILVAFKQSPAVLGTPNNYVVRIPFNGGLRTVTASENTEWNGNYQEMVEIDSLVHNPNVICYFEAVVKTSASMTNDVRLFCSVESGPDHLLYGKDITGVSIPTGTTSYTLFRSQAFYLPKGDKIDFYPKISAASGGTTSIIAWRIILIQGTGNNALRSAEVQIELGDGVSKSNTTLEPITYPKYWKYDASHWDGSIKLFLEIAAFGNGGTVTVTIQQDDGTFNNWTDWYTLPFTDLNAYTFGIPTITSEIVDGRHYRLATKVAAGGYSYTIYNCKFLVCSYEGASTWEVGTYDTAYDILGGTSGSGQLNQAKAQYFPITKTHHATGVKLSLKKTGTPTDNVVVDIVSVLDGSSLAHGTLAASGLSTSWEGKDITFDSPVDLSAGNYYIQVTRSGARDASNYVSVEGQGNFDDNLGQAYNRDNNTWATINYDLMYQLISNVGVRKLETVDTLLNTGDSGTGLQNTPILYDESDWDNVSLSSRYAHDSTNANDNSKLVELPSTDIEHADVTGQNEQIGAEEFSWPASGKKIDVNVVNSTGQINHGKIITFITLGEEGCNVVVVMEVNTVTTTVVSVKVN